MSLNDLPTELDSMIISHLADDKKTLNALSKISKSHRPLAEAYLYKELFFCADDWESLALLLLTLFRREQLGLYIKSLKVDDGRHLDCAISPQSGVRQRFRAEAVEIAVKIIEIAQSFRLGNVNDNMSRAVRKFFTRRTFANLFETPCTMAPLSLILSPVPNLEQLSLCQPDKPDNTLPRCQACSSAWIFMSFPWHQIQPQILGKLSVLSLRGTSRPPTRSINSSVPSIPRPKIFPSMTELRIYNCDFGGPFTDSYKRGPFIYQVTMPSAQDRRIQTLIFKDVGVTPKFIMGFIGNPWFNNLKELRVTNNRTCNFREHKAWDMHGFIQALEQHTPNLEVFEWSNQPCPDIPPVFSTFKNLKHLRKLSLDINLMASITDPGLHVLQDPSWLPPNLRLLMFNNVTRKGLEYAVNLAIEQSGSVEDAVQAFTSTAANVLVFKDLDIRIIIDEHRTITTRYLTFHTQHPQELKGRTIRFLRAVANAMEPNGTRVQAWYICSRYKDSYKLAVAPEYTAKMTCTKPN
jgi:hypothetical protein